MITQLMNLFTTNNVVIVFPPNAIELPCKTNSCSLAKVVHYNWHRSITCHPMSVVYHYKYILVFSCKSIVLSHIVVCFSGFIWGKQ